MATADVAAVKAKRVHADRVDGGARDPRAAAPARHAVVHHVPAQQRNPLDRRVDHQRPAHGKRRGDAAQLAGWRSRWPADGELADQGDQRPAEPTPIARISRSRDPAVRRRRKRARREGDAHARRQDRRLLHRARPRRQPGHGRRSHPADRHRVERAGGGRPLRIIVDDPAPADPAKPRGLRMCDPDPALAALYAPDPRAC